MSPKLTDRFDSISENVLVKLWARLTTVFGIPIAIGVMTYLIPVFVEMRDTTRATAQTQTLVVLPSIADLEDDRRAAQIRLEERTKERFPASEAAKMEDRILYELRKEISRIDRAIEALRQEIKRNG